MARQSQGSRVHPQFPVHCCQEIATAPLGPRNDIRSSLVIARSEATWQSVLLAVGPRRNCLHGVRIAAGLTALAMTSVLRLSLRGGEADVAIRSSGSWSSLELPARGTDCHGPDGPRNDRCGRWSAPGFRFPLSLRATTGGVAISGKYRSPEISHPLLPRDCHVGFASSQ